MCKYIVKQTKASNIRGEIAIREEEVSGSEEKKIIFAYRVVFQKAQNTLL